MAGSIPASATPERRGRRRGDAVGRIRAMGRGDHMLKLCVAIVALAVLVALSVPVWGLPSPRAQNLEATLKPPFFLSGGSMAHPLGTDFLGRDVLSQLAWGSRMSLTVGVLAVLVAALIGAPLGIVTTYRGGWVEEVTMRVLDILLAVPTLLLAIVVLTIFGASLPAVVLVIGLRSTVYYARTLRSRVLTIREEQYVKAARAIGLSDRRILWRHVAPGTIAPLVVLSTIYVGLMIITESSLSFLGLTKIHVSWGFMVAENMNYLATSWWTVVWPGLCIFAVVFSINVIGDFLRDVLDPRLQPTVA